MDFWIDFRGRFRKLGSKAQTTGMWGVYESYDSDKLFGTVTTTDISKELQKSGFSVDRRDIVLQEPIKVLGQHKATVKYGEGLEAGIMISVERT